MQALSVLRPPTDIQDNHLIVEVTADISQTLGTGIYSVEVTGRVADTAFADGYHDYTVRTTLCRVTSDGSDATPTKVTASVIEGLRGLSAYEIAVKHGYTGTEDEWAKSLVGNGGADAYEVAKKAGYTGSREAWLETLIGEPGKSAYELAKAEGYEGSLTEWLASLKGESSQGGFNKVEFARNLVNFSSSMIEVFYKMLYHTNDRARDPEWIDGDQYASWLFEEEEIKANVAGEMYLLNENAKDLGYDYELDDTSIGYRHVITLLLDMMEIVAKHTYKMQKKEEAALAQSAPTN